MEWIGSLNKAIDYIETRLLEDLTYEDIAEQIYSSSFHFQRVFSMLTGMTLGEYIRNRRLSLAGQELVMSNLKVIDVALKYGYETPESFTKAFSRFHGITPNQAKKEGSNLKSFNRLVIKIKLEGGNIMDYRIVKREAYTVFVKVRSFTSEDSNKEIPKFWTEYHKEGYHKSVCGMLGICEQADDRTKEFRYGIGAEAKEDADIPAGFEKWTIPAYTWAVFKCVGPMPRAIQEMWGRIYSEWLPQAEYELIPDYDIELYTDEDAQSDDYITEIWIPVQKK